MAYDGADRHVQTISGGATVRYVRDALDRIIERKAGGVTVAKYSYSGGGDSAQAVLDPTGATVVQQRH